MIDVSPKPPIPPIYLGDAVYAEFSNNMIGLTLDDHRNPALICLERDTWNALKSYAQRIGWEEYEVPGLPEPDSTLRPIADTLANYVQTAVKSLNSFLRAQPIYADIHKALIERAQLKEATFTWDTQDLNIHFSGNGHHLAQVFRVLRTSGFELQGDRPQKNESSWTGRFINSASTARIWISFTSTVCQMRLVRYEMKSTPVYDTIYDEGADEADQEVLYEDSPPLPSHPVAVEEGAEYPPRTPTSSIDDPDIPF